MTPWNDWYCQIVLHPTRSCLVCSDLRTDEGGARESMSVCLCRPSSNNNKIVQRWRYSGRPHGPDCAAYRALLRATVVTGHWSHAADLCCMHVRRRFPCSVCSSILFAPSWPDVNVDNTNLAHQNDNEPSGRKRLIIHHLPIYTLNPTKCNKH